MDTQLRQREIPVLHWGGANLVFEKSITSILLPQNEQTSGVSDSFRQM